ncbi:MAG: DNA-directed RNA polymerase subunit delta [Firmicutes bacterium]|nr:DNA-directed RNA polymerase subunit delta [Bacillota bacterium]
MKLKNMKLEELELLSYSDLTYKILKEEKRTMNTATVFHKICDLLGYSEDDFSSKIGDYYTSLNNDKRFVMLDNGEWDVRDNHAIDLSLDEDDDELISDEEENEEEIDEIEEVVDEEEIDSVVEDDDLDDDDDLEDLAILDEDELEETE